MARLPTLAAAALLLTACAADQHAWQPTEPSFGRDQALAQQGFCGTLFNGLAAAAEDPDDRAVLTRMGNATKLQIAQLGAGQNDPNVIDGERHASIYAFGANADQLIAAERRCVEVVMMGEKR